MGTLVAVASAGAPERRRLAERLATRGYAVRETAHFAVGRKPGTGGQVILVHTFDGATIDEDVSPLIAEELGPLGAVTTAEEYGRVIFAIVASTCPASLDCATCGRLHLDQPAIWRHYGVNTLDRLGDLLTAPAPAALTSPTAQFAAVYRRVLELRVGGRLLDVGSNLGIMPVLVAERAAGLTVVGCDLRPEAVATGGDLAAARRQERVTFVRADLLAPDFREIGAFDTVTAVHVLEHLPEAELPTALANALDVTARRLVVSVPYEDPIQPLYGHAQAFTPDKLAAWGRWCVERLGGGRSWCEELSGGLLVVERPG